MFTTETCCSSNEWPFNKEQNDPNLEFVANTVVRLWLFLYSMRIMSITSIAWIEDYQRCDHMEHTPLCMRGTIV